MKLRICRDLYDRAWGCAESVQETLTDFVGIAVLHDFTGRLSSVEFDETLMLSTRADSTVIDFTGDARGWASARVKLALVRAVLFAESTMTTTPLGADVVAEIKEMNRLTLRRARRMAELGVG